MYTHLKTLSERPEPFSTYTADVLWTDPHIAAQMLRFHLDPESDLASRRPQRIESIVGWIDDAVGLSGKAVCDLGCGPGLYALRMAARGARVTGVDFSASSIAHAAAAARAAGVEADFRTADYLHDDLPAGQDLAVLIYGDYCALSPQRRARLLARVRGVLRPGGALVFDVFSIGAFDALTEVEECGRCYMAGFWAPGDYFGFRRTFLYAERKVGLDRYLIAAPERIFTVDNWMQYFAPENAVAEARAAGFSRIETVDALTGGAWTPGADPFAVVARA